MLDGDQARIRLAFSVMFALPGAPMVFYGDEIGMGDDLSLPERMSVRTPMQWTSHSNGGFSSESPRDYVRPMISAGDFGFERVSVSGQRGAPNSLLNWVAGLMRTRRECPQIGSGKSSVLDVGNDSVLAIRYDTSECALLVLNNLSPTRRTITLDLASQEIASATDLFCDRHYGPVDPASQRMVIRGSGYRWMRFNGVY